jgi:PAS domain S-box-containing protein
MDKPSSNTADTFLTNDSVMSGLVRKFDWSRTPLGAIAGWPQSLRTSVNIVLNSPVPVVMLWGKDGCMIYNDAYAVFAGARHPQLLGSKVVEGWPEVADFNRNVMKQVLQGKTLSYDNQQLTLHRNNVAEEVWMNLNYSPIADESGKPTGVLAIVVETTQQVLEEKKRKDAEDSLRLERQKLEALFNEAPAFVAVLQGPEHVYALANPGYMQLVGHRPVMGKPVRTALPELADSGIFEILDTVYKSGKPFIGKEVELQIDRTDTGRLEDVFFNFVYQPISNGHDGTTDILVHAVEVTEQVLSRKKVEQIADDLARTKQMFDALFDSTVMAIAMCDLSGNILQANRTFLRLFGYTKADLRNGLTSAKLSASGFEATTHYIYDSVKRKGEAEPVEKRYVRKDGTEFPGLVGGAMLPNSDNEFMAFILDLSENEKLKELNEAKDEFIAVASHQLRTPATSVKQYIGIMINELAGPVNPDQLQYLNIANNANNRQLDIINDLLKTAEMDIKGYMLSMKDIDLVAIVESVTAQYEPVLDTKNQHFDIIIKNKTLRLLSDESEISNCLANLIENASKYSPGNTTITVKLVRHAKEAEIIVKDQGVGIADADKDKIFEKFTRVNNALSDTVNGNGLGLYWVKRIVELHHGRIGISSKVGSGTAFSIRLPL